MPILASKSVLGIFAVLLLSACEKNEFTIPVPVGGGSSGGYSYSPPKSAPKAPPAFSSEGNIPGQVEIHYAATENGCYAMQKRFRNEGRKLTMRRPQFVGGSLPWKCVFDGEDATDNYYGDDRYGRDR